MKRINKIALRVSPSLSLETLRFGAEKIVAQTSYSTDSSKYHVALKYAATLIRNTPGLSSAPSIRQLLLPSRWPQAWWFANNPPLSLRAGAFAAPPPALTAGAAAATPTTPMIASGAYFGITSGGWIMLNSSDASLPANVKIASSPPGCSLRKLVTSRTSPLTTTQQSVLVVCLPTSSKVYADMPGGKFATTAPA